MTKTTPLPPCPLTLLFSVYSISICKFVEGPVQIAPRLYLSLLTAEKTDRRRPAKWFPDLNPDFCLYISDYLILLYQLPCSGEERRDQFQRSYSLCRLLRPWGQPHISTVSGKKQVELKMKLGHWKSSVPAPEKGPILDLSRAQGTIALPSLGILGKSKEEIEHVLPCHL